MSVSLSLSSEDEELMQLRAQLELEREIRGNHHSDRESSSDDDDDEVTEELLRRCTAPLLVLFGQAQFIYDCINQARTGNDDDFEVTWAARPSYRPCRKPILPIDVLPSEKRMGMSNMIYQPNKIHNGKYILCQTISPATKDPSRKIAAIEVAVMSPSGSCAIRLVLYNYCILENPLLDINFDEILPPGIFIILKNPWFRTTAEGVLVLHCDNPAELEFISLKKINDRISNFKWNMANKKLTWQHYQRGHLWNIPERFDKDEDEGITYERLKKLGSMAFADRRFTDAIRFYDLSLEYCVKGSEQEVMTLSNKSSALIILGCFNSALICAEAALEIQPENSKVICRKARSLIGNLKYEDALTYLGENIGHLMLQDRECEKLMDMAKFLYSRKDLGPTESQLIALYAKTFKDFNNIPEFVGSLTVSQIDGKGRGYIATEDICPGQLLICAKAFAYHQKPQGRLSLYIKKSIQIMPCHEEVVTKIANKLLFDPQLGTAFYNLYGGSELKYLEEEDWKNGQVDMERIDALVKINAFGSNEKIPEKMKDYTGVWLSPSLLNHSCSEFNCVWNVCGEIMTVRAIGEIKKGAELMITYINPTIKYSDRRQMGKFRDFICSCKLCELESKETYDVKNERMEILENLRSLDHFNSTQGDLKNAVKQVEQLYTMREENVDLNFCLLSNEVLGLGDILFRKRCFDDCISVLMRAFEVAKNSVLLHERGIKVAVKLIDCHISRGDKNSVDEWVTITKEALMKSYGTLEPILQLGKHLIPKLNRVFNIDFFKD